MPDYSVDIHVPDEPANSAAAAYGRAAAGAAGTSAASSGFPAGTAAASSVSPASSSDAVAGEKEKPHGPSRSECEEAIRRILITETLENGANRHFKNSTDFMPYFEALYPAGPGLRKQVQRALKSLDLPKDDSGYYMVHKTKSQAKDDSELAALLADAGAVMDAPNIEDPLQMIFISLQTENAADTAYIASRLARSATLAGRFETMIPATNGIVVLTREPGAFRKFIAELLPDRVI